MDLSDYETNRAPYLWFGNKGLPRDDEALVDGAEVLSHDGETAPLSAACAGCQPLDGKKPFFIVKV